MDKLRQTTPPYDIYGRAKYGSPEHRHHISEGLKQSAFIRDERNRPDFKAIHWDGKPIAKSNKRKMMEAEGWELMADGKHWRRKPNGRIV